MDIQVSRGTENPPTKTARAPGIVFHARSELDVQPRPRLAPDTSKLDDLSWSGVPLRIRLFIDARGAVVDAVILQSRDEPKVNALVSEMFLETGFVPGRIGTQDVASYKDIELGVGPPR